MKPLKTLLLGMIVVCGVRLHSQEAPLYCAAEFCTSVADLNFGNMVLQVPSLIKDIAFTNNTDQKVSVSVTATSPFMITTNRCLKGAKAHSHCNVYVEYTSTALRQDSGTLTFNYGSGSIVVTLEGTGVSEDSTVMLFQLKHHVFVGSVYTPDGLNWIPDGEPITIACSSAQNIQFAVPLIQNGFWSNTQQMPAGKWWCTASYAGDEDGFGPSNKSFGPIVCDGSGYCYHPK